MSRNEKHASMFMFHASWLMANVSWIRASVSQLIHVLPTVLVMGSEGHMTQVFRSASVGAIPTLHTTRTI